MTDRLSHHSMSHAKELAEKQWAAEVEKSMSKKRSIASDDLALIEGPLVPDAQVIEVSDITVKDSVCGIDQWPTIWWSRCL